MKVTRGLKGINDVVKGFKGVQYDVKTKVILSVFDI